jgi:hypothetical protein
MFVVNNNLLYGFTNLFAHLPIEGHLGSVQVLELMSKTAKNNYAYVFLWPSVFSPLDIYQGSITR